MNCLIFSMMELLVYLPLNIFTQTDYPPSHHTIFVKYL